MGCWTGYVVRDASGTVHQSLEKWGPYEVKGPRDLDQLVAHVRAHAGPVQWDGWLCRGLYVDLVAHEIRFYACALELTQPLASWLDARLGRFREALGDAYRVSYAWEGRHELARLVGATCVPEVDPDDTRDAVERLFVASREIEGLRWDPIARTLHYPRYALLDGAAWATIIAEDGRVHDVGLGAWTALPYLFASGPEVLARLEAEIPTPLPLQPPDEHAIFDRRTRRVSLWSREPCAARAGWEGWSFERILTDTDDHLARTGRRWDEEGVIVADAAGDLRPIRYVPLEE